jgi:hypothetical protein
MPSLYHPKQLICSRKPCQNRRRVEYHKQKLRDDADYRDSCRDSQRLWRESNPDYMRKYRKSRLNTERFRLEHLLELVKNNSDLDLRRYLADAWIAVPRGTPAENTFASAKIIVFEVVGRALAQPGPGKNILLAVPNENAYK